MVDIPDIPVSSPFQHPPIITKTICPTCSGCCVEPQVYEANLIHLLPGDRINHNLSSGLQGGENFTEQADIFL